MKHYKFYHGHTPYEAASLAVKLAKFAGETELKDDYIDKAIEILYDIHGKMISLYEFHIVHNHEENEKLREQFKEQWKQ